jgi:hypothetical protein
MEESEREDWGIVQTDSYSQKIQKSISAYYLDAYYDKVKEYTFNTKFIQVTSLDDMLDVLPFEKCMIKFSNKSPKDSEFWGAVRTKEEIIKIIDTSLRCKKNVTNVLCLREWSDDIVEEYRLFWNRRLVAISVQRNLEVDENFNNLIYYATNLPIPFWRCVMDICKLKDGTFKLVEFNSWETNSGGHLFDWKLDTEILYDVETVQFFRLNR